MLRIFSGKNLFVIFILHLAVFFTWKTFINHPTKNSFVGWNSVSEKNISLSDGDLFFPMITSAKTVDELLAENKIILQEKDQLTPEKRTILLPGMHIAIKRAHKIMIEVDGKTIENYVWQKNVFTAIEESGVIVGRLDKIMPEKNFPVTDNLQIQITRINVEEKIIPEEIAFKTISNEDRKMGWREKKITQAGEKGILEVKYRITYKNNKEISRVALEKNITKDPIPQIVTQGTYMQLKSPAKGIGTWYAWKGGLFAASTTIPKGSYARVTNTANGKSVIVQINDYGPQGKGRIIDLDKVAFAKIASIGAGVIGVKVEEILN
jgi:hypothetical protein